LIWVTIYWLISVFRDLIEFERSCATWK